MEERFVIVGEYSKPFEAWLARDRLTEQGIPAFLDGEEHNVLSLGQMSPIRLRVPESDAPRATGILMTIGIEDLPPEPSEDEATDGVWVCSICGEAVPLDRNLCPDCGTSRGTFKEAKPSPVLGWRPQSGQESERSGITTKEERVTADVPPVAPESHDTEEPDPPEPPTSPRERLAQQAVETALLGSIVVFALSLWSVLVGALVSLGCCFYLSSLLHRFFTEPGDLTPAAKRYLIGALILSTPMIVLLLSLMSSLRG